MGGSARSGDVEALALLPTTGQKGAADEDAPRPWIACVRSRAALVPCVVALCVLLGLVAFGKACRLTSS